MDQFASALGRAGDALLIDCRSLDVEWVPLRWEDRGLAIVVVDSKVPRRLAETPYNERREECARAARCLGVTSLRDATEPDLAGLPEPLRRRARHVVRENGRVRKAVDALAGRDPQRFGALMYESHESLRDDFEASCPELDLLVDLARRARGVLGSRLTGAGFGGCTASLVQADALDDFQRDVLAPYRAETGLEGQMMACQPADGLSVTHV
jgi:galactokinase